MDPATLQDAWDVQAYSMSAMAAFAWICYDIILSMDQEIEHIWRSRFSAAKVLYVLARYMSLIIVLFWWLTSLVDSLPAGVCRAWPVLSGLGIVVIGVSVDLIQILRIRALFHARRKVTIPLYIFFACVLLTAIVVIVVSNSHPSIVSKSAYLVGCNDNSNNTATLVAWIAEMVLGGVFFLLTLVKMRPYFRNASIQVPFMSAFFQGGVSFFAIIFATELLNTIFTQLISQSSRPNLENISQPWTLAVYGIAAPRLVLHLHGVMSQSMYGNAIGIQDGEETEMDTLRSRVSMLLRGR